MNEDPSPLGRYDDHAESALVEVQLRNLPVAVLVASREHHDELMREFRLMALSDAVPASSAPRRLVDLIEILGVRYAASAARPDAEVDAALARGQASIDLTYHVPAAVGHAAQVLDELMREADELCRAEQLLTLSRSQLMIEFAQWYLRCFVDQIAGQPPEPWAGPAVPD